MRGKEAFQVAFDFFYPTVSLCFMLAHSIARYKSWDSGIVELRERESIDYTAGPLALRIYLDQTALEPLNTGPDLFSTTPMIPSNIWESWCFCYDLFSSSTINHRRLLLFCLISPTTHFGKSTRIMELARWWNLREIKST